MPATESFLIRCLVLALVIFLYRREARRLRAMVLIPLMTLRALAFIGVGIMLLQPVLVFSRKEYVPSRLPVLVDTSRSMGLQDAYADPLEPTPLDRFAIWSADFRNILAISVVSRTDKIDVGTGILREVEDILTLLEQPNTYGSP